MGDKVVVEIVRPTSPLAAPPPAQFVSPTLVDSLLAMLPEQHPEEELLDLGFSPEDDAPTEPDLVAAQPVEAPCTGAKPKPEQPIAEQAEQEKQRPRNAQERVRGLGIAEQQKIARTGEQGDRVALERMYGKNVWEALLKNPRLTAPEAARISRMGSLPTPLLDLIVSNRSWISSAQVRRGLLSNRRLSKDMVLSVLRATPKSELRLMPKQNAYPVLVREAAAKLLK